MLSLLHWLGGKDCTSQGFQGEANKGERRNEVKLLEGERRSRREREILQDQAGSGCLGLRAMGSRQQIDYGAETLIRCLSPISLP